MGDGEGILPARLADYEPSWLDAQCLAGRSAWARLAPPCAANGRSRPVAPIRSAPIALLDRRRVPLWMSLVPQADAALPSPRARAVLDCLAAQGAQFFEELAEAAHLLRPQVEEGLAELVALGLVTSDSFGRLRALLVPSGQRKPLNGTKRRGRVLAFDMESGGRWALIRRTLSGRTDEQARAAGPSSTWRAACCAATGSCSIAC